MRAIPSAVDTAAGAFEPNESGAEAAFVPMGEWIEAAWDYRGTVPDQDFYRFEAPSGQRIRLTLRNPNAEEIFLRQYFSPVNSGMMPDPGQEMSQEYLIEDGGSHYFEIGPYGFPAGRYSLRIDPLP